MGAVEVRVDERPPPPTDPCDKPTADDPLRGLKFLGPIALVGRQRIMDLAAQPIEYIWQDIALAGTIVLIAGAPGEGKTTLLFLVLAGRLNQGEPIELLGRLLKPAPPGQWVVLIEGEHSEASTARKLIKSLRVLDIGEDALDRVIILARKAVRLGSPEWMDVCDLCAAGLVSDIAIDTVARVAPADANDEREQVAIFSAVAEAIERSPEGPPQPIVWTIAHTRKNGATGDLADVSGSAQRTGQADTVLLVKGERADGRTIASKVTFAKLREDPDDYPLPITFAIEGTAIRTDGEVKDGRPLPERILDLLAVEPLTKSALAKKLGRSKTDVEAAITELFASRSIRTTTIRVRGVDRKAFERPGFSRDDSRDVATDSHCGTNAGPTGDEW